jgi:hypothetical protein
MAHRGAYHSGCGRLTRSRGGVSLRSTKCGTYTLALQRAYPTEYTGRAASGYNGARTISERPDAEWHGVTYSSGAQW